MIMFKSQSEDIFFLFNDGVEKLGDEGYTSLPRGLQHLCSDTEHSAALPSLVSERAEVTDFSVICGDCKELLYSSKYHKLIKKQKDDFELPPFNMVRDFILKDKVLLLYPKENKICSY